MTLVPLALAATLFVECENFEKLGGWVVETQSMRQLGSSYVMAHGYGNPVADAWTIAGFPEAGEYTVWARTRNWNAEWTKGAAGRFRIDINMNALSSRRSAKDVDKYTYDPAQRLELRPTSETDDQSQRQ